MDRNLNGLLTFLGRCCGEMQRLSRGLFRQGQFVLRPSGPLVFWLAIHGSPFTKAKVEAAALLQPSLWTPNRASRRSTLGGWMGRLWHEPRLGTRFWFGRDSSFCGLPGRLFFGSPSMARPLPKLRASERCSSALPSGLPTALRGVQLWVPGCEGFCMSRGLVPGSGSEVTV
jgi:hypothetical protein